MSARRQTGSGFRGFLSKAAGGFSFRQPGFVLVLAAVWVILNERATLPVVATGLLVGVVALGFTNVFVLNGDYGGTYGIRPLALLRYILVLIVQIYVAGFHAMAKILTGKVNVNIVAFDTVLRNEFHIALLANSITLTPGTVTMEKRGRHLRVIWIDAHTLDPELAGEEIKGTFERLLAGAEPRRGRRSAGGEAA